MPLFLRAYKYPLWIILDSRNETYYQPLMVVLNHKASMPESDD
jgi:hypothetical protein